MRKTKVSILILNLIVALTFTSCTVKDKPENVSKKATTTQEQSQYSDDMFNDNASKKSNNPEEKSKTDNSTDSTNQNETAKAPSTSDGKDNTKNIDNSDKNIQSKSDKNIKSTKRQNSKTTLIAQVGSKSKAKAQTKPTGKFHKEDSSVVIKDPKTSMAKLDIKTNKTKKDNSSTVTKTDKVKDKKPDAKNKPDKKHETKPTTETKPDKKNENKPTTEIKPDKKNEDKPTTETKPDKKSEDKPTTETKPDKKNEDKPTTETKPDKKNEDKPTTETKPDKKNEDKPTTETKPDKKNEDKPTTETKPDKKNEDKPTTETKPSGTKQDNSPVNSEKDLVTRIESNLTSYPDRITITLGKDYSPNDWDKLNDIVKSIIFNSNNFNYGFNSWGWERMGNKLTLKPNYSLPKAKLQSQNEEVTTKVDTIINTIIKKGMSELQKEKAIHDYIVNNTVYNYANYKNNIYDPNDHSAYGPLILGTAVCEGYAKAMNLLLNKVGIESFMVTGLGNGGPHAWNIVKIDGKYYNVDSTFDDPVGAGNVLRYTYFNKSDSAISFDHSRDDMGAKLPKCTDTKYDKYTDSDWSKIK
ncbi:transglutaminase domain-containing protein [Hathewaya histolytica]|uniref:transglutaminase domain-containing protein n=1 Tax=Hathewaya histolytica TaxID=1498 RepID=UPI003B66B770